MNKKNYILILCSFAILSCVNNSEQVSVEETEQVEISEVIMYPTFKTAVDKALDQEYSVLEENEKNHDLNNVFAILNCQFSPSDSADLLIVSDPFYNSDNIVGHFFYRNFLVVINSHDSSWKNFVHEESLITKKIPEKFLDKEAYMIDFYDVNYESTIWLYAISNENLLTEIYHGY